MERNIEYKDLEPDQKIVKLIDQLISRIEKNTNTFSSGFSHLRLFVERIPAHTLFRISLTLDVPAKTLVAKHEEHDLKAGLRSAFEEIDRQLKKHKESLRGEHWKRPARREEFHQIETRASSSDENKREVFFSLITLHLNRLNHFVHHVIAYAEAMGDLQQGDLTPQDVVDGVLVRAYLDFSKGKSIPDVKGWLVRHALDQLETEVLRLKTEHAGTASIEEDVPETPQEEVSTWGDEMLNFYQRDEDLKLEDLVPDMEAVNPEEEVETKELQDVIRKTLVEMPRPWRRVLVLHDLAGRSRKEIAKEIGKPESEVDRTVQLAREYLRQKLTAAGYQYQEGHERAA
jgi:RNA polymerase sigma factor (sigma-70 family)